MDTANEPRPGDDDFDGFRMRLPEDCVEYMLFVIGDKSDSSLPSLETIRKAADHKLAEIAPDYIWQKDPFKLDTKVQKGLGLPFLYGATHYGDNVEDEWLIVYLLRELTKSFSNLWVRVSDSDGEFLLIEAAKVAPKWLTPENDANRVWIHDGKLLVIPLDGSDTATTTSSKSLTLPQAVNTIRTTPPSSLVHSPLVEAEAFYRLEKYPGHIATFFHHARVTIPRKLAYVLHSRPHAVAPATEAFYLRDPKSLKPLLSPSSSSTLTFPPADLVTISVRFTKTLYAQLKSQRFSPPPVAWREVMRKAEGEAGAAEPGAAPADATTAAAKALARLDLGMKLTTGFELLVRQASDQGSASRLVREVALLLEDLAEDGGDAALPSDAEIARWEGMDREDDDSWMDIDFADLEKELAGNGSRGTGGFGDAAAQADLRKIVSRFEAFLNDESAGIDGAEIDEMDRDNDSDEDEEDESDDEDEDKEVSFDEEQFARMMREMMGLPAEKEDVKGKKKAAASTEVGEEEDEEDEDEEIRKMMEQMESELKGLGALELDRTPKVVGTSAIKDKGEGQSKGERAVARNHADDEEEDEDGSEDSDGSVDIDYNLAKNLLESFKTQAGMAGPASNLLGLMGMKLPRDEGNPDEEQRT
ncbi:hypothetical protein VTJ83DRAFT_2997 [Remersonia thermophila]|uniref:Uncharacterized protein n=1 Tax=Remersonia thermophila TaxID=72144 RepID=A0ABR4DCS5_9PEZI